MENIYLSVFIFVFGAVVGSFLNVMILRWNTGQSIISGRSKCFSCAKKLKWHELLPIASFVFLRGKCSACKTKISWQYPIVETTTGLLFLLISNLKSQTRLPDGQVSITLNNLDFFYFWIIFSLLIIIAVYDYRHRIIPNLFVWIFNFLAFLNLFRLPAGEAGISDFGFRILNWNNLLAGFILFALFSSLWGISRGRWMGFGDAKLALGIGWLLGIAKGATAITLAFWIGAIVGVALIYLNKNKYGLKSSIAFGPFMILGTVVSFFWGERIISFLF